MLAARINDMHVCPMITPGVPPIPHVGGPILPPCAVTVLTGGLPQARVGDMAVCVGPPDVIVMGAFSVLVIGQPAARFGDLCAHGGTIVMGQPNVLIGSGAGGGGGGGGGGGAGIGMGGGHSPAGNLLSAADASMSQAQQAAAYKNAAKSGAPFCQRC